MKPDTDFDLLLTGVPPAEARRLQKILAEWSRGDEGGFPVQLALLTRAQFRANAVIPKLVEEQRQKMLSELEKLRAAVAEAGAGTQDTFRQQLVKLETEVTRQSAALRDANARIQVDLAKAVAVATRIEGILGTAERGMTEASSQLTKQCEMLVAKVDALVDALDTQRFLARATGVLLAFIVGVGLGTHLSKDVRATHQGPPVTPPSAVP